MAEHRPERGSGEGKMVGLTNICQEHFKMLLIFGPKSPWQDDLTAFNFAMALLINLAEI